MQLKCIQFFFKIILYVKLYLAKNNLLHFKQEMADWIRQEKKLF